LFSAGEVESLDRHHGTKTGADANDFSAKMPEKTKEMDQTLTAFFAQVKATTVQTKTGKGE